MHTHTTHTHTHICVGVFIYMGGSGEKTPSKDMKKIFYQLSNLSQPVFLLKNPTHWGLETAVCPIFTKTVLDIFAICLLVPSMNLSNMQKAIYAQKIKTHY